MAFHASSGLKRLEWPFARRPAIEPAAGGSAADWTLSAGAEPGGLPSGVGRLLRGAICCPQHPKAGNPSWGELAAGMWRPGGVAKDQLADAQDQGGHDD